MAQTIHTTRVTTRQATPQTARRIDLDALFGQPWALLPSTLTRIAAWSREAGHSDPGKVVALDGPHGGAVRFGSVSVLPVYGVIEHRSDWMLELLGGTSIDGLREAFRAALGDPNVRAVVLDIDSPGGTVAGMTEFAAEVRAARGGSKPIVAVANTLAASAAYWLACQADELVVTPSGWVGSVGVYAVHQEVSRLLDEMGVTTTIISAGPHKTEGNEFVPLTDEARADIQGRVDEAYSQFLADVAAGRRVPVADVEANFGGGRVLVAKAAVKAGMADRVATLEQTVQRLGRAAVSAAPRTRASVTAPDPEATDAGDTDGLPFTERMAAFATEATAVVNAAEHRARSRAAEHRPSFSTTTETALRESRDAIDHLLALGEPAHPELPGEPAAEATSTPRSAAPSPRRISDEEWRRRLEIHT